MYGFLPAEFQDELKKELEAPFLEEGGWPFSLTAFKWIWANSLHSSDPRVSPALRWGVSPAGFRDFLLEKSRFHWNAREKFIAETSACDPQKCFPESSDWKGRSSVALDWPLLRLLPLAAAYCENVAAGPCRELQNNLDQKFDLFPGMSLRETMKKFLTLNYDPRHSLEIRRAGLGNKFRMIVLHGNSSSTITDESYLLDIGPNELRIWNIRGEPVEIEAPASAVWATADLKSGQAWFRSGNEIGLANLEGVVGSRLSLPFAPQSLANVSKDRIFAFSENNWALIRFEKEKLNVEFSGAMTSIFSLDSGNYILRRSGHFELLSLAGPSPLSTPLSISEDLWKDGAFHSFSQNKLGWFFARYSRRKNDAFIITREGKAAIDLSDIVKDGSIAAIDDAGTTILTNLFDADQLTIKGAIFSLNERGGIASRRELAHVKSVFGGFVIYENNKNYSYLLVNGKFAAVFPDSEEEYVYRADGEYIWAKKGKNSILRKAGESGIIYDSQSPIDILSPPSEAIGLIRICDGENFTLVHEYMVSCRIESLRKPENFSLLTGISFFGGLSTTRDTAGRMRKGFALQIGYVSVWLDPR